MKTGGFKRYSGLLSMFASAAFTQERFGGIPLPNLTPSARAGHKKNWTDTPNAQTTFRKRNGAREVTRRLAFKAKHGHFA